MSVREENSRIGKIKSSAAAGERTWKRGREKVTPIRKQAEVGMVAPAFNPSSQEAEGREYLLVQGQISLHSKVPGQPDLHNEICHGKGRGEIRNEGKKAATIPSFIR